MGSATILIRHQIDWGHMDQNQQQPPPHYAPLQYQTPPAVAGGGKAVASLVLGICALTLGWCSVVIGVPLAIVGLILGILDRNGPKPGMAKAGIILSIISLVLQVAVTAVVIVLIATDRLK
jgi:hypothetical protein